MATEPTPHDPDATPEGPSNDEDGFQLVYTPRTHQTLQALQEAERRGEPVDLLGQTHEVLRAVLEILSELEFGAREFEHDPDPHGAFLVGLLAYGIHRGALDRLQLICPSALLEFGSVRFRHGRGPYRCHCGSVSSAAEAALSAYADINGLLDAYLPLNAFYDAFALSAASDPGPAEVDEDGFTSVAALLGRRRAVSPELEGSVKRFPMEYLRASLLRAFDDLRLDEVRAELFQEYAQAARDWSPEGTPAPAREADGSAGTRPARGDGPEPPCWLWWKGVRHKVGSGRSRRPWQLLCYLWGRQSATFEELQGPGKPWPDPVFGTTFSTTANRVNLSLPPGFPRKLVTRGGCVLWQAITGKSPAVTAP